MQTDREGRRIERFLVSRSRSFQQTLVALVHEVRPDQFPSSSLPLTLLFFTLDYFEPTQQAPLPCSLCVMCR